MLCFADIVRDCNRNRQKSTQKASILTDIVAKDTSNARTTLSCV